MNVWDRFRKWSTSKKNAPARRLLGIAVVGTVYVLTGSVWASFVALALWLCLAR